MSPFLNVMNRFSSLGNLLTFGDIPVWRDVRVLKAFAQIASAIVVVFFIAFFVSNVLGAAEKRGLDLGFDYLSQEAGFPISETVIEYAESDSFGYAFVVGMLNTLKVVLLGLALATILGVSAGVARLSSNWIVAKIALAYVETFRNVPLLIQLFIWYFAVFQALPLVHDNIRWPGPIYLSNRGVFMAWPSPTATLSTWLLLLGVGFLLSIIIYAILSRVHGRIGRRFYPALVSIAAFVFVATMGWVMLDEGPLTRDVPVLGRFNFDGGAHLSPEFAALVVGLVVYTGAFIAEIVRAGIQSVQRGQSEAARSLGLTGIQTLRFVVFPQALRVIIPPLINQYLNLSKNSSLAIAIGYPDLFSIGRTMVNQAGRAVPTFMLIMVAYLAASLAFSLVGNLYNRRARIVER